MAFADSFSAWWDATKKLTGDTIKSVADAAEKAFTGVDEENIRLIMKMKNCDHDTALAYYSQFRAEQEPMPEEKPLPPVEEK